jgi:hypothetical protein
MRRFLILLVAWLALVAPAVGYPSESLRLPPTVSHYRYFPGDVDRPPTILAWQIDAYWRFPFPDYFAAITEVALWQDERNDCPTSLRTVDSYGLPVRKAGNTFWDDYANRGRIELNGQYDAKATLYHEGGHAAQHWAHLLPAGHPGSDPAGRIMHGVWVALPGPDTEEDFANGFRDYLLGQDRPFYRWFPAVLALWRPRATYIYDALFTSEGGVSFWQWWDHGRIRLERFDHYGRHLFWDGYRWTEV